MLFWFLILLVSIALVVGVAVSLVTMVQTPKDTNVGRELKGNRLAAFALLAVAPVAAVAIYLEVGAPQSIDPTFREEQARLPEEPAPSPMAAFDEIPADQRLAMIENMVEGLATRLETTPDDFEGWRMLARSYGILGRKAESVEAYRQLTTHDPNANAEDWRNYATALFEAQTSEEEGYSDAFLNALERLQAFNKDDPLSLFYLGQVAREQGNGAGALVYWRRLLSVLPADAPIRPQLASLIEEAESVQP
ncbi:MAG: hypothetical protein JKX88_10395 [Marinicaulis sp.]|nr:hypothetical protein [Marinicaulis sp.]